MIVTVTPNPSIDRTVVLPGALVRGGVHRVTSVSAEPGGKGVNVARALSLAGVDTLAVLPAGANDPILDGLRCAGVPYRNVPVTGPVRTNLAITETDGTTTKINEPGSALLRGDADALVAAVMDVVGSARWVVLSGSLPPGLPDAWYSEMVARLRTRGCRVAVDTSDAPLAALAAGLEHGAPDLMKPNAEELGALTGVDGGSLEAALANGDAAPVVAAARRLITRGVGGVLATLGAAGAVFVDTDGAWLATPPPVRARSTVGAGDSALAGYLRAEAGGAPPAERLRMAVAYGSAAAALPGSALPGPAQLDVDNVVVTAVADSRSEGVS